MVLAVICAASVPILSKIVLNYVTSPFALLLRMLIALIILALFMKFILKTKFEFTKHSLLVAVFGGLNFSFFILGIKFMPTIFTPVFYSLVPIQATILGWLFFRDRVAKINLFGILIGLAGALVLFSDSLVGSSKTGISVLGFMFLMLASFCITIYGLLIERFKKLPSAFNISFQSILFALLLSLPIAATFPNAFNFVNEPDVNFWLAILSLAAFGTILQYVLYQKSIQAMGKLATVLMFYLQPIFVIALSAIFLNESINWITYVTGMVLILLGSSMNMKFIRDYAKTILSKVTARDF